MIRAPNDFLPCLCPGAPKFEPTELNENVPRSRLSMRRCPCYKARRVSFQTTPEIKCTHEAIPCNIPDTEIRDENNQNNKPSKVSPGVTATKSFINHTVDDNEKAFHIRKLLCSESSSKIPYLKRPSFEWQAPKLTGQYYRIPPCCHKLAAFGDRQEMRTLHSMKRCPCFSPREESVEEEDNKMEKSKEKVDEVQRATERERQIMNDGSYENVYNRQVRKSEINILPVIHESGYEVTVEEEKEIEFKVTDQESVDLSVDIHEDNSDRTYFSVDIYEDNSDRTSESDNLKQANGQEMESGGEIEHVREMKNEIMTPYNSEESSTTISASSVSLLEADALSYESCHCEMDIRPTTAHGDTFDEARESYICKCVKRSWRSKINLPTIAEFKENKCIGALYEILEMAKFDKHFVYIIDFVDRRRDGTLDVYKYVTTFSIPTKSCPVPEVTARLYFVIIADRAKLPDRPVQVYYFYEYASSLVNILNMAPSETPVFAIMKAKMSIYRNEARSYA